MKVLKFFNSNVNTTIDTAISERRFPLMETRAGRTMMRAVVDEAFAVSFSKVEELLKVKKATLKSNKDLLHALYALEDKENGRPLNEEQWSSSSDDDDEDEKDEKDEKDGGQAAERNSQLSEAFQGLGLGADAAAANRGRSA